MAEVVSHREDVTCSIWLRQTVNDSLVVRDLYLMKLDCLAPVGPKPFKEERLYRRSRKVPSKSKPLETDVRTDNIDA